MPIIHRSLALQEWKHHRSQAFHKTVHIEKISLAVGNSDFRPGAPNTEFSVLVNPPPIVRIISEGDISEGGQNISLGDYVFEINGSSIEEQQLRDANQITLAKGLRDEENMQILQIRPAGIESTNTDNNQFFILGGLVVKWKVYCRATQKAA